MALAGFLLASRPGIALHPCRMTRIKVTALKDVEVYLSVVFKEAGELGGPRNSTGWVFLRKGQSRDDVSLIIGIHAKLPPKRES